MKAIVPLDEFRGELWGASGCLIFSSVQALAVIRERWGEDLEAIGDTAQGFLERTTREVCIEDPEGRSAAEKQAHKAGKTLANSLREFLESS